MKMVVVSSFNSRVLSVMVDLWMCGGVGGELGVGVDGVMGRGG